MAVMKIESMQHEDSSRTTTWELDIVEVQQHSETDEITMIGYDGTDSNVLVRVTMPRPIANAILMSKMTHGMKVPLS